MKDKMIAGGVGICFGLVIGGAFQLHTGLGLIVIGAVGIFAFALLNP